MGKWYTKLVNWLKYYDPIGLVILGLLFLVALLWAGRLFADELDTTWRAGDLVPVVIFCMSKNDAERLVYALVKEKTPTEKINCVVASNAPFGIAHLGVYESGPFVDEESSFSVWQIVRGDNIAWTFLPDDRGRHNPATPI